MQNLESIDPTTLQNLLGNNQTSLISESLVTTIIVSLIVLNVLGVLFLIVYVLGLIRKWKVQSAILHMQKDLAEIKSQLAAKDSPASSVPTSSSRLIAAEPAAISGPTDRT